MSFKPLSSLKLLVFIIFVFGFALSTFLGHLLLRISSFEYDFFIIIFAMPFLIVLVFTIWVALILYILHKLELVFHSTTLELRSISALRRFLPRLYRPFIIDYKAITKIKHWSFATAWEIIDENNKAVLLNPLFFEKNGGEKILAELRLRLPEECFEEGFKVFKPQEQKGYKIKLSVGIALFVAYSFFSFFDRSTFLRSQLINAWEVEKRLDLFERSEKLLANSSGEYWMLSSNLDKHFAYHWSDSGNEKKFNLPDFQKLDQPRFVSGDEFGNPIVWLDNRVIHLTNDWQAIPYRNNLQIDNFERNSIIYGEEAWTIVNSEDRTHLIHVYGLTGEWFDVPLPPSAIANEFAPFKTRPLKDNSFLVLMRNQNNASVYLFSNGNWQDQEYPLNINVKELFWMDIYIDSSNNLLTLTRDESNNWIIKRISPLGMVDSTYLPSPLVDNKGNNRYEKLYEDSHGRLWILGAYPNFISVLTPSWGSIATELTVYTKANSNFQAEFFDSPILLPDGKLLSADDYVSSIDTNVLELPVPLPNWFADLNKRAIGLTILIAFLLVNLSMTRRERRTRQSV